MRIGIDCRSLQEPEPSGVSLYTKELVRALVRLPDASEHTFVLFMNGSQLRRQPEWLLQLQQEIGNERVEWRVKIWSNKLLKLTEVLFSLPTTRWMFGEVDVVIVPTIDFYPLRANAGPPILLTIHDLSFERYANCLTLKGRLWHRLLRPRKFVHRAAQVMAVSDHTASDVETIYGINKEKITTVYPGMPPAQGHAKGSIDPPERFILSLGTLEPRKNIPTLIQAFDMLAQEHPDVHLVIAGGVGWKSTALRTAIQQRERVHYFGYINEATKQHLLERAEMFVYPSLYEGFGFPPLEAARHGTPVIVGAHSSLPEVLGNSALYVDVLDADSLRRGMNHLLTDQALRETLIEKGKKNVERFDWVDTAQQTLDILKSLV